MTDQKFVIRSCMLYEFRRGNKATDAAKNICGAFGDQAVSVRVCQQWFSRFKNGDFDLNDKEHTGRPRETENDKIQALLDGDPRQSSRQLADKLGIDHKTVLNHLHQMGKIQKVGKWVPHQLLESNQNQRLTIVTSLLVRQQKKSFLHRIVTGDEKWIYYENPTHKKQWLDPGQPSTSTPKSDIHRKKVMLSVWWDNKGILYYELLPPRQTVNSDLYKQQLMRLSEAIEEKRPLRGHQKRKVILLHDNATPHVATSTHQTIMDLEWEVLP